MKNANPEISIIVPMHNSSQYIEACIESILLQDFSDYELLLIDDHSSDNTVKICKKYLQNEKVKLISNNKRGVSSARNLGITKSNGNYMTFIDSDDVISKSYLSVLLKLSKTYPDYLAMCGYIKFRDTMPAFYANEKIIIKKILSSVLLANIFYYHSSSWGCLFRSDLIKKYDIKMEEKASFNEDVYFTSKYICVCKGGVSVSKRLYGYRINCSGIGANKNHSDLTIKDVEHRSKGYYAFQDALSFARNNASEKTKFIDIGYSFIAAEVILTSVRANTKAFKLKKTIKGHLSPMYCIKFIYRGKSLYQILLVIGIAISPKIVKYVLDDLNLLEKMQIK